MIEMKKNNKKEKYFNNDDIDNLTFVVSTIFNDSIK